MNVEQSFGFSQLFICCKKFCVSDKKHSLQMISLYVAISTSFHLHSLQMIRSRNSHIQTFTDIVQIPVTGMSRSVWLCHSSFVIRHVDINNHIQSLFFILTKTKILKTVCIRYDKIIHPCNQRDYQASQQGNLKSHIKYQITF